MAINPDRPTITYENIAVFQSNSPAHNAGSNAATGISFVPLAESVEISFSVDEKLVREIGNKKFNQKQSYLAPNVNFSLAKKESFTGLFNQLTGTNTDTNFYVAIKDKKLEDVISGSNFNLDEDTDFISIGNCFLNTVEVSQNIKGLMQSRYSYVGSNLTAQTGSVVGSDLQIVAPSLDLTGDQTTGITAVMPQSNTDESEFVVPYHKTNVSMQASGQNDNSVFTILSDSIQSFSLNCAIERRSVYSIGKKHVINRKKVHPNLGSFTVSNVASAFRVDGDSRTRLDEFIGEKFTIKVTGNNLEDDFHGVQLEGQLVSQDLSSQIGPAMGANFNFTFDLETLKNINFVDRFIGASLAYSLRSLNTGYISGQPDYVVRVRRSNQDERSFTADEITDGTLLNWVGTSSTNNGFVTIWYDQSGNGKNAINPTNYKQPKIVDGGVLVTSGGNPAIKSTGGAHQHLDFIFSNQLSADGQQSLFVVVENNITVQANNYPAIFRLYSTTTRASTNAGRNRRPYWFISKNTATIQATVNSFSGFNTTSKDRHLFSHIMNDDNGGTSTIHQDGVQVDSRSITLDANSLVLATSFNNERILEVDRHSTGDLLMSELIYYTSDQASNRDNINSEIKKYYGIT